MLTTNSILPYVPSLRPLYRATDFILGFGVEVPEVWAQMGPEDRARAEAVSRVQESLLESAQEAGDQVMSPSESRAPPQSIVERVQRFEANMPSYQSPHYNEASLRVDFLDALFGREGLGWDVHNDDGAAERYKDVVVEEPLEIGGRSKRTDYVFRVGGTSKFIVEAKKPAVNILMDSNAAYQLRRYGWNKHLNLCVLTNFENFVVYDVRKPPKPDDPANVGRVGLPYGFRDYLTHWDKIAAVFSKESVLKGRFDDEAEKTERQGNEPVDEYFLKQIESWRRELATSLKLRNPSLTQPELNFAVQAIIDRIIFLRICEDRGVEPRGRLRACSSVAGIYQRLLELFRLADQRYNSGLFHFDDERGRPSAADHLTPGLTVEDGSLKTILDQLYESPYDFRQIPLEVLGQVYEQFLGRVIVVTEKRARIEEKPEVRKAGGIFYTPQFIVDFLVLSTLQPLLAQKTPEEAAELRVLDPACGSGSFLLRAYDYLLDWHLAEYSKNPKKWKSRLVRSTEETFTLTSKERSRILLSSVFGVDVDSQAVEVTKLALLLKALEKTPGEAIDVQLRLFHERALPDLDANIKCGNSIVGTDFFRGSLVINDDLLRRINPFDFKVGFPAVAASGGFDAVIGNPPYVRQESLGGLKDYFQSRYSDVYHGSADLYTYFIHRGISLLKPGGRYSVIVANRWFRVRYGAPLRRWVRSHGLTRIVDFGGLHVFRATTYPCLLQTVKDSPTTDVQVSRVLSLKGLNLSEYVAANSYRVPLAELNDGGWSLAGPAPQKLLTKICSMGIPLRTFLNGGICYGVKTGDNDVFVIDAETRARLIREDSQSADLIRPFMFGGDIKRYQVPTADRFLVFTRHGTRLEDYPAIERYLTPFRGQLTPKPPGWKGSEWNGRKSGAYKWFEIQDTVAYHAQFTRPKILVPHFSVRAAYTIDLRGILTNDNSSILLSDDPYVLGWMNSKVSDFVMRQIAPDIQSGYYQYKPMFVAQVPIVPPDRPGRGQEHADRIRELARELLGANTRLLSARAPHDQALSQETVDLLENQLDHVVYAILGLTPDEIGIIERSLS